MKIKNLEKRLVGNIVIVKNGATVVVIKVSDVVDAKDVSYDIKKNAGEGILLLCVISGEYLSTNNTHLDDELNSSLSKKISVFVYKNTEISFYEGEK